MLASLLGGSLGLRERSLIWGYGLFGLPPSSPTSQGVMIVC